MKRTFLYEKHLDLGARMIPFAGFEMPLQYSGIIEEHTAVRSSVGVFDLSHMGELEISGPGAKAFLQKMTINDVSEVTQGQAQYTAMCLEDGGIIDDCVLYRLDNGYLLVANAVNIEKDFHWLKEHMQRDTRLVDVSRETTLIAVQGPKSRELLTRLTTVPEPLNTLEYYQHKTLALDGVEVLCARTGYTGELGFELYIKEDGTKRVWDGILAAGSAIGIRPIGLGARDTLRLEMKYCLYGNDIDETTNPLEAGLGWITKPEKGDFVGKKAILNVRKEGPARRLVGFEMTEVGIPRKGYILSAKGEEIGTVTSGCYSPSLRRGIGMAYVRKDASRPGTPIEVSIRGRSIHAEVIRAPFWKKGTVN
ncbi:MAG: glycine cleavage system aminomethyltransferase GcvT [Candidatus Neomarinimicrobiota bacterium]